MTTSKIKPYLPIGCPIPSKPTDWAADILTTSCYVQPKMNGVKALLSPDGKVYKKSGERAVHLDSQFGVPDTAWIDGELWHPDMSLEEIAGLTNRQAPDDETAKLQFWAVDLIHPEINQCDRFDVLLPIQTLCADKFKITPTKYCEDPLIAANWYREWQNNKAYDGIIYRNPLAFYEFGKTKHVLKRKRELDAEYLCIGVTEGMGKFFGMLGSFQLVTEDGTKFSCGGGCLTTSDRQAMWKSPPIGQKLQVTFPYYSSKGIPQCPQFLRIRNNTDV